MRPWIDLTEATAYHGTAYTFDSFSAEYSGAKNKANMLFGWGIYFTNDLELAGRYRDNVQDMRRVGEINDRMSELAKIMRSEEISYRKFRTQRGRDAAQEYDDLMDERSRVMNQKGVIYEAEIPDRSDMLIWDNDRYDQSEHIKKSIGELSAIHNIIGVMTGGNFYNALAERLGSKRAASLELYHRGVKGTEFRDLYNQGVVNYVVYSGNDVKIIGKS